MLLRSWSLPVLAVCALQIAGGCSSIGPQTGEEEARVRLTEFGVPHVSAGSYEGLGRGYGYAFAEQNLCLAADLFVSLRGERTKFFGPAGHRLDVFAGASYPDPMPVPNPVSDLYYKATYTPETAAVMREAASEPIRALTRGYVDGYNRYLADVAPEDRPEACRNADWVRPITEQDLYNRYRLLTLLDTSHVLGPAIAAAAPPDASEVAALPDLLTSQTDGAGSNVIAFGQDATPFDGSLVFGNPHFPWFGENRLHAFHLRHDNGDYDVFGSAIYGLPFHNIGFNRDVAWSITFSTDKRAAIYVLELDPSNPTRYRLDGEWRDMEEQQVTIDVRQADGSIIPSTRTLYSTEFGPLISFGPFQWTTERAFALFDVNRSNVNLPDQFLRIAQSKSVEEVVDALRDEMGMPFSNLAAGDSSGNVVYANISRTVNLSDAALDQCRAHGAPDFLVPILIGVTTQCAPQTELNSPDPGIIPADRRPVLFTTRFVMNSNDSHWMPSDRPEDFLAGFQKVIGDETSIRTERTRAGLALARDRLAATDGLAGDRMDAEGFEHLYRAGRWITAEHVVDDLVEDCRLNPSATTRNGDVVSLTAACDALEGWDRTVSVQARGAHLFRLWVDALPGKRSMHHLPDDLWLTPFDPERPVDTPTGLRAGKVTRSALAEAVQTLSDAGVALDAPLGDVQFIKLGDERVAFPGGENTYNYLHATLQEGEGFTNPILSGNSYIQLVEVRADGPPRGRYLVTYSQSTDPASPHASDMTRLIGEGRWIDIAFTDDDIEAQTARRFKVE